MKANPFVASNTAIREMAETNLFLLTEENPNPRQVYVKATRMPHTHPDRSTGEVSMT